MALLTRELHRSSRAPLLKDEDQWHLVFDTDSKRLYVEHRWTRVDVRGPNVAESGIAQLDIAEYLKAGKRQVIGSYGACAKPCSTSRLRPHSPRP